ncbi:MAG: MarC family protein [Verrucomicrobiaceae bacterium]
MEILTSIITLFMVFDPFGNAPVFQSTLSKIDPARQRIVLVRELIIALVILALFTIAGTHFLSILNLRPASLSISGGILLFLIALGMIFPKRSVLTESSDEEPFIVPLAVPLLAGPSAIAILLIKTPIYGTGQSLLILLGAWVPTAILLLLARPLLSYLGAKGSRALERLMGLILILVAVQMILDGTATWIKTL